MVSIQVTSRGDGTYRVVVAEGSSRTTHEVRASTDAVRRYGGDADAERLIEASFRFLLEREPKESILASFELPVIERYFPEYPAEIRKLVCGR